MQNRDILEELDIAFSSSPEKKQDIQKTKIENTSNIKYTYEVKVVTESKRKKSKFLNISFFFFKYSLTCAFIFGILVIGTNYSAYFNIAKSYLLKEQMEEKSKSIINSVEASNLKTKVTEEIKDEELLDRNDIKKSGFSMKRYKKELNTKDIQLNIEITPYENRIVIPKIGKNIPLLDIKNREVQSEHELENIFMKELENGVIRYPGSALPGENGTTFIFGHSSNFPWMKGDYNDVFSTLNNINYGDEVILYYGQKKYKYIIREKKVITPGDVSVLKRNKDKNEISIMTCWPIGTVINRLIVTGELAKE